MDHLLYLFLRKILRRVAKKFGWPANHANERELEKQRYLLRFAKLATGRVRPTADFQSATRRGELLWTHHTREAKSGARTSRTPKALRAKPSLIRVN